MASALRMGIAFVAFVGVVCADPMVTTERGHMILRTDPGSHVVVETGSSAFNVDDLPGQIQSVVDNITSTRDALSQELQQQSSNFTSRVSTLEANLGSLFNRLTTAENATESLGQVVVEANRTLMQAVADVSGSLTGALATVRTEAEHAYNASVCAASGLRYNMSSSSCYAAGPQDYHAPEYDSGWFAMESQKGTQSYKEIIHGLNFEPERIQVIMRPADGDDINTIRANMWFEGSGSGVCDDDGACQEYGGMVYAYDNNRVRIWLPDRNNGHTNGRSIFINDGWGADRQNIISHRVWVMVKIWRKYRLNVNPDYDSAFNFTRGAGSFRELTFRQGANAQTPVPERVLVEVKAVDGRNRGFTFVARGSSGTGDHGSKNFGGTVFAYNASNVRVWGPTGGNGAMIFVHDGWGGEVNLQNSLGRTEVRVRVWNDNREVAAPAVVSKTFEMCAECNRTDSNQCGNPNGYELSYQQVFHGLGVHPRYVKVETKAIRNSRNAGYVFEGVHGAVDDETQWRNGLVYAYDSETVYLWAPTRYNNNYDGRILGLASGWGNGRFSGLDLCAEVTVKCYL